MTKPDGHTWEFKTRFRKRAFGWKSQPAISRVKQAVAEIKKVAKRDPVLAGEGAVMFFERVAPALEQVDSSSGAIGTAVNNAIVALVPVIASAPADAAIRAGWLERLFAAHQADRIPYIELLADHWGELCGSEEVASEWADQLIDITRRVLAPKSSGRDFFHGTLACLSALFRAGRTDELIDLLSAEKFWAYKRWAIKALAAQGKGAEAIRLAESCRSPWASEREIDSMCEEILLSAGEVDQAYLRYGLSANHRETNLATFRAVVKKYPQRAAADILTDLASTTPGEEGKWFAAAKSAGLYDVALALATRSPCDPKTLIRAARDFALKQPAFAASAGFLALHWLVEGYGYEITSADAWDAYRFAMAAAEHHGGAAEMKERIRELVASESTSDRFVSKVLGRELRL